MAKQKGKDPAFLLYTSDFLTGTYFMTDEQVGLYIRLLCLQHQKDGRIDASAMRAQCKRIADGDAVMSKFEHDDQGYYNARLEKEINLRAKKSIEKSEQASDAAKTRWNLKHMQTHCESNADAMRYEDVNENEDVNVNQEKGIVRERGLEVIEKKETALQKSGSYEDFIRIMSECTGRSFRGDSKSKKQFHARLRHGWTFDQMKTAIANAVADPYHRESGFKYITPEFMTREDKLDKFHAPPKTDGNRRIVRNTTVADIQDTAKRLAKLMGETNEHDNDSCA